MVHLPLQAFGIGDIIFTQTLMRELAGDEKIIWPVMPWFIDGLKRAYPDINWIDQNLIKPEIFNLKKDTVIGDAKIYPIRWAEAIQRLPFAFCMKAKYMLYKKEWKTWVDKAYWNRDCYKENELTDLLELKKGDKFNLINSNFKCDASGKVPINVNNGLRNIEMKLIEGFSLFDWAWVFEWATEIHTVSTSVIYLFELLDLKAKIHIYIRRPQENNHNNYSYILQRHKYILH